LQPTGIFSAQRHRRIDCCRRRRHFFDIALSGVSSALQIAGAVRASGSSVTFEPDARTAWHAHPLGQTRIVTGGYGRVQRKGGPAEEIRPCRNKPSARRSET
jgi:quercetin dioxygenase-like cupin family protein